MKTPKLKLALIYACALLCQKTAFAQTDNSTSEPFPANNEFRTWSVGVSGGLLSQYTVFLGNADFKTALQSPGYGLYIKKQFVPALGIQLDGFGGQLSGKTAMAASGVTSPFAKYNTDITWGGALSLNLNLVNLSWRNAEGRFQIYTTLGGGMMAYKATVTDYADVKTVNPASTNIYIPVGLGLKLSLARSINLDLGYTVNFVDADNVDGHLYNANNDRFAYSHIGLEFILGKSSKPKMSGHNPLPAMRAEYVNSIDALQKQVNTLKTKSDSIQSQLDRQTTLLNQQKAQNSNLESIVTKANTDSDNDGVADKFDKCPNTPAGVKVDGSGCPLPKLILSSAERQVVDDVVQRLEFELMKSTIKPTSYPTLDKFIELMLAKNAKLKLDGYTDNTGPDWRNLALSTNRANAVKKYLVKKGIPAENIIATGHGNSNPIGSNETIEGRKQNRRVDFTLY